MYLDGRYTDHVREVLEVAENLVDLQELVEAELPGHWVAWNHDKYVVRAGIGRPRYQHRDPEKVLTAIFRLAEIAE